ncbi:MFS transporter [Enterococcus sp. DIV0876]|uniref:MFS transporter n=1 Tax=Enterococcus sp. DIV0876 TaxID=2774633 RepID=UPI003D2FEBB2
MEKVNSSNRLWSKDFYLVMVVSTLAMTAITTQMGTLPLYVASLGGTKSVSGAIVGVLGIAALCCRLPIGVALDRYGRKGLLCLGLGILLLDFGLLTLFHGLLVLFCLRIIQGVGNSLQATAAATLAVDTIPEGKLAVGLGYFSIAQAVPSAIGPLIGLTIVENYGFSALFRVAVLLSGTAFLLSFSLKEQPFSRMSTVTTRNRGRMQEILRIKAVLFPSGILFLICFANSGIVAFIAQYASEHHIVGAGYYFTVMSVMTVLTRVAFPRLLEKIQSNTLIYSSLVLILGSFCLLPFTSQLTGLLVAAACYGVGYAGLLPVMNTIVLEAVTEEERGQGTAIFSAALDVAYGSGAFLWGIIASLFGFQVMFWGCGLFALAAIILYHHFQHNCHLC